MDEQRRKSFILLILLLIGLGIVPLLWPGDAPWIDDEAQLMHMALHSKNTGEIATHGLTGTRGAVYGPFPTWIYTLLLHLSNDIVEIVRLRAALVTLLTALAIFWIALNCSALRPSVGALALLSPYLWFYSRNLWDNSFLIPLSALLVAAYISFCAKPAVWKSWIIGICVAFMVLTHFMCVALIVPILAHIVWLHRQWIRGHVWTLGAQFALISILSERYVMYVRSHAGFAVKIPDVSGWPGWIFPFLGGRFFSFYGVDYFFGENWFSSTTPASSIGILLFGLFTWCALALVWVGMGMAVMRVWRHFRSNVESKPFHGDADFHLSFLSLAVTVSQCLLNGWMRTYTHPHFFNTTWICFYYFFWTAFSNLPRERLWRAGRFLYVLAMAACLGFLISSIHRTGGNQQIHYGPALQAQINIVRKLNAYHEESQISAQVLNSTVYEHSLNALGQFYATPPPDTAPLKKLLIRPVLPPEMNEGWLTIVEEN